MQQEGEAVQEQEQDFSEPWEQSDVVLLVEEKKFHVHRLMLSMCSPVFSRMFSADFKEKDADEITLPDKKAAEIREMLLVIYPVSCKQVDDINLHFLLPLAQEYQINMLTKKCEDYLLRRMESKERNDRTQTLWSEESKIDFTLETLIVAQTYSLERLSTECINKTQNLSNEKLRSHEWYKQINPLSQLRMIEFQVVRLEEELKVAKTKISNFETFARFAWENFQNVVSCLGKHIRHAKDIRVGDLGFEATMEQNMEAIQRDSARQSRNDRARVCTPLSSIHGHLVTLRNNLAKLRGQPY